LSAYERRQLKKGKDPSKPKENPPPKPEKLQQVDEGTKLDQSNKGGDRISQRGGGKKKVSKYDEWDEEEKAARAMLLGLGAKGKEGKTKGKAKAKDSEMKNLKETKQVKGISKPPRD